jgi:anion-transporting  ArsA/GET3 family ATPase
MMTCRIRIILGTGGVGKTSLAGALALRYARQGYRTLVITIDPAQRLKTILDLKETPFGNTPASFRDNSGAFAQTTSSFDDNPDTFGNTLSQDDNQKIILPETISGSLYACLLHSKKIFDDFVSKGLKDPLKIEKLFQNRLYQQLSTELNGSQEFTALEKLCLEVESGRWDYIVLDTPPSGHALDFLKAPQKLHRLLDDKIARWFRNPETGGSFLQSLFYLSTKKLMKALELLTGEEFLKELSEFFDQIHFWQEKLTSRLAQVQKQLLSPHTEFLLVTNYDEAKIQESLHLLKTLRLEGFTLKQIIINKAYPFWFKKYQDNLSQAPISLQQDFHYFLTRAQRGSSRLQSSPFSFHETQLYEVKGGLNNLEDLLTLSEKLNLIDPDSESDSGSDSAPGSSSSSNPNSGSKIDSDSDSHLDSSSSHSILDSQKKSELPNSQTRVKGNPGSGSGMTFSFFLLLGFLSFTGISSCYSRSTRDHSPSLTPRPLWVQKDPTQEISHNFDLLLKGHGDLALQGFESLEKQKTSMKDSQWIRLGLARSYFIQGNLELSITILNQLLKEDLSLTPDLRIRCRLYLAEALEDTQKLNSALASLEEILTLNPSLEEEFIVSVKRVSLLIKIKGDEKFLSSLKKQSFSLYQKLRNDILKNPQSFSPLTKTLLEASWSSLNFITKTHLNQARQTHLWTQSWKAKALQEGDSPWSQLALRQLQLELKKFWSLIHKDSHGYQGNEIYEDSHGYQDSQSHQDNKKNQQSKNSYPFQNSQEKGVLPLLVKPSPSKDFHDFLDLIEALELEFTPPYPHPLRTHEAFLSVFLDALKEQTLWAMENQLENFQPQRRGLVPQDLWKTLAPLPEPNL